MQCTAYAHLSSEKVKKLQAFEKEFDAVLVAYEKVPAIARLSEDEIGEVREKEKKLGKILIAYEK
jgi:Flp pilus assembly protein CpaB